MKSKVLLLCTMILLISIVVIGAKQDKPNFSSSKNSNGKLIINEVVPYNTSLLADRNGIYYDLIEIFNGSDKAIDLTGYGLSDDPMIPHKWVFPSVMIETGEMLIVYAAGDNIGKININNSGDSLYATFKLDEMGEKVLLSDSKGKMVSSVAYERLNPNMSIAWIDGEYRYLLRGTPMKDNNGTIIEDLSEFLAKLDINPSRESGIYSEAFELTFADNESYDLRYTLDGSDPSKISTKYESPIYVDDTSKLPTRISNIQTSFNHEPFLKDEYINKGLVVKARYFDGESPVGDMFVGTYFVWDEGSRRYSMDVVSLTTDPNNLFNQDDGIYVVGQEFMLNAPIDIDEETPANYHMRGKEWERPANIEFFDQNGQLVLDQSIGIRIFGSASRGHPKKSIRIIARKEYGKGTFDYEFFDGLVDAEGKVIDTFESLILRSGGSDYRYTMFRDILTDQLSVGMLDFQAYKPIILFINGEYFGIYNLREYADENYVASHYDIDEKDVGIIALKKEVQLYSGDDSALEDYNDLISYLQNHDMTKNENLEHVADLIDLDNMVNYYSTEIYVNNSDWPGNNIKLWKYTGEPRDGIYDGKFRFILFDADLGFGLYRRLGYYSFNSFEYLHEEDGESWRNPTWSTILYQRLMLNSDFREFFLVRLTDLLNSRFRTEVVLEKIDYLKNIYVNEIEEYSHRYEELLTFAEWDDHIERYVKNFPKERIAYLLRYAKEQYNLEGIATMSFECDEDGSVLVNDQYEVKNESRVVKYFTDYVIHLEAKKKSGSEFVGWEITGNTVSTDFFVVGNVNAKNISFYPVDGITVKAVYK